EHPIDVYNHGRMERDFTYVDDVVESVVRLCALPPERPFASPGLKGGSTGPAAPYRVVNVGGARPITLLHLIEVIEAALHKKAVRNYMDRQPGEMLRTEASADLIETVIGYRPATPLSEGIDAFIRWYRSYYDC